jgi:hypothetical protein
MEGLTVAVDAASRVPKQAESRRSVEVHQTGGGVIALGNRPAGTDDVAAEADAASARILSPTRQRGSPLLAATGAPSVSDAPGESPHGSDARWAALWGGLAMIVLMILAAAWVAWERRRRAAAHYAALLAPSEPRPGAVADSAIAPPSAVAPAVSEGRFEPAATVNAPPSSRLNTPPASERQWLSQPPPRSSKDPPD